MKRDSELVCQGTRYGGNPCHNSVAKKVLVPRLSGAPYELCSLHAGNLLSAMRSIGMSVKMSDIDQDQMVLPMLLTKA
jgi:hypothetical protein